MTHAEFEAFAAAGPTVYRSVMGDVPVEVFLTLAGERCPWALFGELARIAWG